MAAPLPILATKLYLPPARPASRLVPRPRLIARVNEGLTRLLTLISAPAGFGKTTLISEWRASLAGRDFPLACLSLDADDNDPARFLAYLVAALATLRPGLGEAALAMLRASRPPAPQVVLTSLINDLSELETPFALVLDDYHVIAAQPIQAALTFLLDHQPPQMRLILLTRADPPVPLARLRARGQLLEIRAADLRFTPAEAAVFLNQIMGLALSPEDVAALEARTEGWIAGLQLAALSMTGRDDTAAFVKAFTGSHVYVAEYLVEEVLQRQPEAVQAFLVQTSILDRLNPGLCQAVTGGRDAQTILTALHRANTFIVPLDDQGRWFRYHHLFADLLQARLAQACPTEAIAALHTRAADWYARNGFPLEAVKHSLAARDFERAALLVEQAGRPTIFAGQLSVLSGWLEALPEASFGPHPRLAFYQFWIELLQGKADLSDQAMQAKEHLLEALPSSPENDQLRGEVMAVVCRAMVLAGRTSRGIQLAQAALGYLAADDLASRARANSALAIAYGLDGRPEEAERAYQACLPQAVAAGDYSLAAHTTMVVALNRCHYGQLHGAASAFQAIIDLGAQAGLAPANAARAPVFFPAGQGYVGLAGIALERNDLQTAEEQLQQGMALCRQGGLDGIFLGRVLMARLRQAQGDLEGALEELQSAKQAFRRADDFSIAARQIQIRLAQGDIDGAARWAAPLMPMLSGDPAAIPIPLLLLEVVEAIIVRVFVAQGETGKALELLDRLQATAEPAQRFGRLIEVYLLRALVCQAQDPGRYSAEAVRCLEQALGLAEPEGYVLLFLEAGPALVPLLQAVVDHQAAPSRIRQYARRLLDAFGQPGKPAAHRLPGAAAGLAEPLTPRELEVLALIAAGDSNQAIAAKLVITVRTVKKHASNIYEKLNAGSRIQAVARAREFGLLPSD